MTAYASFTVGDSSRLPDSTDWAAGKQSGQGRLGCKDLSCTDTLSLSDALGSDTAQVRLHKLGLLIATYRYTQTGRAPNLVIAGTVAKVDANLKLLAAFYELRKAKVDSFAKVEPITARNLVDFYASLVYAKDSAYAAFPQGLPVGMNADSVRTDLVRLAVAAKSTWTQVAASKWGLDSASIHTITLDLLEAGLLAPADTLVLFPPPPIRVLQAISLQKRVSRGGAPVGIAGRFSWDKGLSPVPTFEVRTRKGIDTSDYHFPTVRYLPSDTSWSLEGNLTLQVDREALPGTDTLVVTLADTKGNRATSRVVLDVAGGDTIPPSIRFESPAADSSAVDHSTELFRLIAVASDSSGIDSIRLGDKKSTGTRCTTLVELGIGENVFTAKAWDGFKNVDSAKVRIFRAKAEHGDSTKPTIDRLTPRTNDSIVDWNVAKFELSWRVTDDSSLAKVSLGDSAISGGNDGIYRANVPLSVGRNTFVLTAFDARGNVRRDTLRLERRGDSAKPVVKLVSPPGDTAVDNGLSSFPVEVSATDSGSGVDSVKIGGKVLKAAPYKVDIDLALGANTVVAQAWDKAGNASATVSVKITRRAAVDSIRPEVKLVSPPRDTSVANGVSSFSVEVSATDSGSGVDSVKIGGKVLKAAPYKADIDLAVGANTVVAQAWDKAGNASTTVSVKITRAAMGDTTRPTIDRVAPLSSDTTVEWSTKSMTFRWTVSDDSSLAKVTFDDSTLVGIDGDYRITIGLPVGAKTHTLAALDARGNTRKDSIRVERLADLAKPVVARGATTRDTILPASSTTLPVSWNVADDALKSVKIEGTEVAGTAGAFTRSVALTGTDAFIHLVAVDSSGNTAMDSVRVRRLGAPVFSPKNGLLSGSQTVSVGLSPTLAGSVLELSSDKSTWTAYTAAVLVSKSRILYGRATLDGVVSAIDSAVFVYEPTFSPAGGPTSAPISVVIAAPGAVVEDSLSTGSSWSVYSTPVALSASAKLFARARLGGLVSAKVSAEYAFAPVVSPAVVRDTGHASVVVAVSASGVDSIETSLDGTTWTRLKTASVTMVNSGTLYTRSRVGASISPVSTSVVHLYPYKPTFLPVAGSYASAQDIEVKSATTGVEIEYSLDGTTWSAYSSASLPTIAATGTIQVRCFRTGSDTITAQASYKISDINWNSNGTPVTYGKLRDTRDGQTYRTTTIGSQIWMAENLNYKVDSSWCFENKLDSCGKHGRLYKWTATMTIGPVYDTTAYSLPNGNIRGVCPPGFHLPSYTESRTLQSGYPDGLGLKSTQGWPNGTSGYNWSGFNAIPGGRRLSNGNFYPNGVYLWTTQDRDGTSGVYFDVIKDPDTEYWEDKNSAYSVRCLAN